MKFRSGSSIQKILTRLKRVAAGDYVVSVSECGHECELVCHGYDRNHEINGCTKPCQKILCSNNHVCTKRCCEDCGPCMQLVERVLPCGHTQQVPCHIPVDKFRCKNDCIHLMQCGHLCMKPCGDDHTKDCTILVNKRLTCGHTVEMVCHESVDDEICSEPCGKLLDCLHQCTGTCGICMQGRIHAPCQSACGRTLVCGHPCHELCTKECPPCSAKCENRCLHSVCPRKCGWPCQECVEDCLWQCQHFRCTKTLS